MALYDRQLRMFLKHPRTTTLNSTSKSADRRREHVAESTYMIKDGRINCRKGGSGAVSVLSRARLTANIVLDHPRKDCVKRDAARSSPGTRTRCNASPVENCASTNYAKQAVLCCSRGTHAREAVLAAARPRPEKDPCREMGCCTPEKSRRDQKMYGVEKHQYSCEGSKGSNSDCSSNQTIQNNL